MDPGHLMELRERRYYKKPTTIRRREKQLAIREQQKLTILEKQGNGDTKAKLYTKKPKKQRNLVKKDKRNSKRDFLLWRRNDYKCQKRWTRQYGRYHRN